MKLSDLTVVYQNKIDIFFGDENETWEKSSYWWNKGSSTAANEFRRWNQEFEVFAEQVLFDNDIPLAFKEWAGEDIEEKWGKYLLLPQIEFKQIYHRAKLEVEANRRLEGS